MNDEIQTSVSDAIQQLYKKDSQARRLFDWIAGLERDATSTKVDRVITVLGVSRSVAVGLLKDLETTGCGRFVAGRRGSPSRFEWHFSRVSIGQVAIGEAEQIEDVHTPISEIEDDAFDDASGSGELTISQAKDRLAKSLGLSPNQIEIQIRA